MQGALRKILGAGVILTVACLTAVAVREVQKARRAKSLEPDLNDPVDLYIEESFPASDPPSYTPISHIGGMR
jgi:hypothetical protein